MKKPIIDARGISKSYKMGSETVAALKSVNLSLEQGESLAIMGPSGSGKSTLMHLLGCLDKPSSGRYFLQGEEVSLLDDEALSLLRATSIGFVFQSFHLIPQLTVIENVEIPFLYRTSSSPQPRAKEALERVGLGHRLHHLPTELSGGEMQRVAIARALAIHPLIILADEPTGNLDHATGRSILSLFEELHQQGVTLILVTHDPSVGKQCQRIIQMQDGQIL